MTIKEVVLAMVDSIENPVTEIDMDTFGIKRKDESTGKFKCYGCAATNTICKIGNLNPLIEIDEHGNRDYSYIDYSVDNENNRALIVIHYFEDAIDYLRRGLLRGYNNFCYPVGLPDIPRDIADRYDGRLPIIKDTTQENLDKYRKFAELL